MRERYTIAEEGRETSPRAPVFPLESLEMAAWSTLGDRPAALDPR
ncbi:MAG: hypothetical protein ACE15F_19050 [bacterium]